MATLGEKLGDNNKDVPGGGTSMPNRPVAADNILGLSEEEMLDPNKIEVKVSDKDTPIVVFFGPPSSGKTMILLRMIRWFEQKGLRVIADRQFRPARDKHYQRMCDELRDQAFSAYAPDPNDIISFMLVTVLNDHGDPVFQILEAPGEHYFKPEAPDRDFPPYIKYILQLRNRMTWAFLCELGWGNTGGTNNDAARYALKVSQMQANVENMGKNNRVVFIFNKCDKRSEYYYKGFPRLERFMKTGASEFPGIFESYVNRGFLERTLFGRNKFTAACFSSGTFSDAGNGRQWWHVGDDWYCEQLWKALR